jgi:hypothetical protein
VHQHVRKGHSKGENLPQSAPVNAAISKIPQAGLVPIKRLAGHSFPPAYRDHKGEPIGEPQKAQKFNRLFLLENLSWIGADKRTRTFTPIKEQRPQRCASTNSAISALNPA